jgi:hypothetical protein
MTACIASILLIFLLIWIVFSLLIRSVRKGITLQDAMALDAVVHLQSCCSSGFYLLQYDIRYDASFRSRECYLFGHSDSLPLQGVPPGRGMGTQTVSSS